MNPFVDKYFTKSRIVAETAGLNPVVKYRVFTRFDGIAALEPMAKLIMTMAKDAQVDILPTGTPFEAGDTIAVVTGRFQDIVELETQWLQFTALPCYCASEARKIVEKAGDKILMDFAARHLFDPVSAAMASYGAQVGGISASSTDVGANSDEFINAVIKTYKAFAKRPRMPFHRQGMGTTPHALIALFKGDYAAMSNAYREAFPNEKFVALVDYNNREVDDTLKLLDQHKKHLAGVRIDTCGENFAQIGYEQDGEFKHADEKGVCESAVRGLKNALVNNGGEHVKVFLSSGFNADKTGRFMEMCPSSFDGIGTGSFIPKVPTATADIFEVDRSQECKIGREWGYKKNEEFYNGQFIRFEVGE